MQFGLVRRRLAVSALLVALIGAPLLTTATAHGDSIGDVQSRAQQVAAQLDSLQSEINADTSAWEAAQSRKSQLDVEIRDTQAKVAAAQRDEARKRAQLSTYARDAYISGGDGGGLPQLLDGTSNAADQRQGYAAAAAGDRQQLIDDLQAAQQVSAEQVGKLHSAQSEAAQVVADAQAKKDSAVQAESQLTAIKSQLDGKLAQLVAEQQAAAQKAAEQKAFAAAQAQEAAQARAAAAANQPVTPAAVPAPEPTPTQPTPTGATGTTGSTGDPSQPTGPVSAPSSAAGVAIAAAESKLGAPYVWGAAGPSAFDCSGLVVWAYAQAGVSIGRDTYALEGQGTVVPLSQIQPGDMVFYWGGGHVALYVGGGTVIHAPHTGDVVRYASLYMGPPELVVRPT
jgi:cell wall-associated NlpC family hydrolase